MSSLRYLGTSTLIFTMLAAAACGDDDSGQSTPTGTTATGTGSGSGGSGGSGGTGTGTAGGTTTGGGGGGTGGSGACTTWLVTYDLTGSTYFIDASLMDFTITCQTPYDADPNMGPGSITLRFPDDGGAPGEGPVSIVEYSLVQNFVTGVPNVASVTTDLATTAGPEDCGVTQGTLSGTTLAFSPAEMNPYCRDGSVSCQGGLCGTSGSPPANDPFVFANDCSEPFPLNDFEFTNGVADFTMAGVVVSSDANQTTTMTFVGTQSDLQEDTNTPGCACN